MSTSNSMVSALFGKTQHRVLALIFDHPHDTFYLREIVRRTGAGHGAVQRELTRLTTAGIIKRTVRGRQTFFQANRDCPIFPDLQSLITKTAGIADSLRDALLPLDSRIRVAFVYGSVARGTQTSESDVDIMVVGQVQFSEVVQVLRAAQTQIGREVNPTVYPVAEFGRKLAQGHHFLTSVLREPKTFLVGDEHELAGLVAKRLAARTPEQPAGNRRLARSRRA